MTQDTKAFLAALFLAFAIGATAAAPCLVEGLNRPTASNGGIAGVSKAGDTKRHNTQPHPEMTSPATVPTGPAHSDGNTGPQQDHASEPDSPKITDVIQAISAAVSSAAAGALVWIGFNQKKVSTDQAAIMRDQQKIMVSQRDIGFATERAWVRVVVKIAGPIRFANGEATASLKLEMLNSGALPAHADKPSITAYPWGSNEVTSSEEFITERINRYRDGDVVRGSAVFPQQTVTEPFYPCLRKSEIEHASNTLGGFVMVIRGAIRYNYPGNSKRHSTTFHVHILRNPDSATPSVWRTIPIDDGVIPASELFVTNLMSETEAT